MHNQSSVTRIGIKTSSPTISKEIQGRISYNASIIQKRISARCPASFVDHDEQYCIRLEIDDSIGKQGYRITRDQNTSILIQGNDLLGLTYGIGKFLHTSQYCENGLIPSEWEGISIPHGSLRGMYFASHFFNWYHVAPEEELRQYIEDIALWGVNTITLAFPLINLTGWDDIESEKSMGQIRRIFGIAKQLSLDIGLFYAPNQDFKNPRPEFRAVPNPDPLGRRGNNGNNICPNIPGATDYILQIFEETVKRLEGIKLDYLCLWPYDEGGCACPNCFPWGANGFLDLSQTISYAARKHNPDIKIVLSTWTFDTPYEGEWEGLSQRLKQSNDWVDVILADSHEEFPQYPLSIGVPGNLPLINFPEISMWGLFPWGGYGANPLPNRFQHLWEQVKNVIQGGFPYSEGIFEDINKVVVSQFYWDPGRLATDILAEYITYEYSHDCIKEVLEIINLIENNHSRVADGQKAKIDEAEKAFSLAEKVNTYLPESRKKDWRWRILYLRTLLDLKRYSAAKEEDWSWSVSRSWGNLLQQDEASISAMKELIKLYHAMEKNDGSCLQHSWVRPPYQG